MSQDYSQLAGLLTLRTRLFDSLSSEISRGLEASIAMDVEAMQVADARKQEICQELYRIDTAIATLQRSAIAPLVAEAGQAGSLETEALQKIRQLWRDSARARAEADRRNRVYEEFLRQAGSTVKVMMNVMSHCLGIYPTSIGGLRQDGGR